MRLALIAILLSGCAPKHIAVRAPAPATEAVLVLPGLGYTTEGSRDIKRFALRLAREGYDVYVPNAIEREGIDESVAKLDRFVRQKDLARYEKLHVVAFILGGVMLNEYLQVNEMPNLASVVYDRSPLQERAPRLSVEQLPLFSKIFIGKVIFDLAKREWPPLERDVPIGLIIENHATWFVRHYRKQALAMRPLTFDPAALGQPHTAYCYVWLDHFEMYHRFDVYGDEVLHFIRLGRFSDKARTEPFPKDPFSK